MPPQGAKACSSPSRGKLNTTPSGGGFFIIILSLLLASNLSAKQRGIKVTAKTPSGKEIPLYSNSYAFVVGNGTYTNGWDPLPGAIRDVKDVARALEKNGFEVTLKANLTKQDFSREFRTFCHKYGRDKDNRILFYYAGHGYTQKMANEENLGYLVMVDTPVPAKDPVGFELTSVDMQTIVTQAKMIKARHVLFMFDSCFSGSILNLREGVVPEVISASVSLPVRQFITAGRANEPVPDHSIFKQAFLDLLEGRDKEPIPDGYITGEELGLYLKNTVPKYNPAQHPQYGKIKDIRLDKGDFVFALKMPSTSHAPAMDRSGGIRDYDKIIEQRKTNKKGWDSWQKGMDADLAKVERYDKNNSLSAEEKAKAWEDLMNTYYSNNPFTEKDDEFRREAISRIQYWRLQASIPAKPAYSRPSDSSDVIEPVRQTKPLKSKLFVKTTPTDSRVRILNIKPKFYPGMELDPGEYHLEVSASGYLTQKKLVELSSGEDKTISIRLESNRPKKPMTTEDIDFLDPIALNDNVRSLLESGKYLEAIKALSKEIALDPRNVARYYNNRGDVYYYLKQYTKSMHDLNKAIELKPDYALAYQNRGGAYANLEQYPRAIKDYDKAIELKPDYGVAYKNRGNAYFSLKQYSRAIKDYDKAIELKPDYALVYYSRGFTYIEIKQYNRAIMDCDKAIELDPEFVWAYHNRGYVYNQLKKYNRAIKDFDKAIGLDPDFALAYFYRGIAYANLAQSNWSESSWDDQAALKMDTTENKAIKDFDKAIELDSDFAMAYYERGDMYRSRVEYDRAIRDFDKAIELIPNYVMAYAQRGIAYSNLAESTWSKSSRDDEQAELTRVTTKNKAIQDYGKAIELSPNYATAYINRGNAYENLKQYTRAIKDYNKAIELEPDNTWAYNFRGDAHKAVKQYTKAIQDYSKIIELSTASAPDYNQRADTYAELGQYAKAIRDYDKAIALSPDSPGYHHRRGNAYAGLGQYTRAIQDYNKVIEEAPYSSLPYFHRGNAYYNLKRYKKTFQDYDEAIEKVTYSKEFPAIYAFKETVEAIERLDKAIDLEPNDAGLYTQRGVAYMLLQVNPKGGPDFENCYDFEDACNRGDCRGLRWAKSKGKCQ